MLWVKDIGSTIQDRTDSLCLETLLFKLQIKKFERTLRENQCAYINDSIGLHRVQNISHTEPALSLHLNSSPFDAYYAFDQRTGCKNSHHDIP